MPNADITKGDDTSRGCGRFAGSDRFFLVAFNFVRTVVLPID